MSYVKPTPDNLGAANGPFILGVSASCVLCGMLITQTWNYFDRYERDTWSIKLAAATVCVLNVVSTGLDLDILWDIGVTSFGNYDGLRSTDPSHLWSIFVTSFVMGITQAFFAIRSWKAVNRNLPLGLLFGALVLMSFAANFAAPLTHIADAPTHVTHTVATLWLWSAAVTDALISGVLVWKLWESRREPDITERTQNVLDGVLLLVLSTASITSATAVTDAVFLSFLKTGTNTHSALTIVLPRLYGNCLLYTLNQRASLRSGMHGGTSTLGGGRVVQMWAGRRSDNTRSDTSRRTNPKGGVVVTRTTDIQTQDLSPMDLEHLAYREGPTVRGQTTIDDKHSYPGMVEVETFDRDPRQ